MPDTPRIDPSWLPVATQLEVVFLDSSFFKTHGSSECLPAPERVRALSGDGAMGPRPLPVKFEDLGLIVKFGSHVTVYEAQCLLIIKRLFGDDVPVPEVYGWRIDDDEVFIYMQLIQGQPLRDRWNSLGIADKMAVCDQLREIVKSLRSVEQDPHDTFVGSIDRQNLHDYVFQGRPKAGPFASIKLFHNWLSWLPGSLIPDCPKYEDPWRPLLPDDGPIKLTHGDLHRGNIIVSTTTPPRILAVIDWAHTGWYPDYWEYCKACYTCFYGDEWRVQWIPRFLDIREEEYEVFAEYMMAIGAV